MFDIQTSNPTALEARDENDKNLDEAIESIFPLENEYAFLIWNHIFIPLSYKYDVSKMIKDIILLVRESVKRKEGRIVINWPSNTFSSSWIVEFGSNEIEIRAIWNEVLGELKDLLNRKDVLRIERQEFIEKWTRLLLVVKNKLEKAGYDSTNLEDFNELEELIR